MNAPPGRAYYESLIDPERLLVVPKEPTPEFRKKIVAEAAKLGLLPEKAGDLHGGESHVWQSARSVRIKQDLRITVDDCELEPDGTLLLKQELRFRPGRRHRRPQWM